MTQSVSIKPEFAHGGKRIVELSVDNMFLYGILEQGPWFWTSSYISTDLGASLAWGGTAVLLFGLLMMLPRLVLGLTRALEGYAYPIVIVASAIISMVCLGLGVGPNTLLTATVFLALLGAAMCMIWPSILAYRVSLAFVEIPTLLLLLIYLFFHFRGPKRVRAETQPAQPPEAPGQSP